MAAPTIYWARLDPSHVGGREGLKDLGHLPLFFPVHYQGTRLEVKQLGLEPVVPIQAAAVPSGGFTHCMPAPRDLHVCVPLLSVFSTAPLCVQTHRSLSGECTAEVVICSLGHTSRVSHSGLPLDVKELIWNSCCPPRTNIRGHS